VGLGGEIRLGSQLGRRLQEAARLGLRRAIIPEAAEIDLSDIKGIDIIPVSTLMQAILILFPRSRAAGRGEHAVITEGEDEA